MWLDCTYWTKRVAPVVLWKICSADWPATLGPGLPAWQAATLAWKWWVNHGPQLFILPPLLDKWVSLPKRGTSLISTTPPSVTGFPSLQQGQAGTQGSSLCPGELAATGAPLLSSVNPPPDRLPILLPYPLRLRPRGVNPDGFINRKGG